ncbi:5-dehydro-4-deoxy-D-glucuronate isomerase [Lewinella sp. LCG006]|uniref:5-dehydro-4-deoxy-D-glucuronate isomerase n=1 Tax=Lewinella sp. LCG006 TaxID=3231911 RepID=UPI0034609082
MKTIEQRYEASPREVERMNTQELRNDFLVQNLFAAGEMNFVYSHYDRMVMGGATPTSAAIVLPNYETLKSEFFLQRRELGIINIGSSGSITADGETYKLDKLSCLYLGKGTKEVSFQSAAADSPAQFFLFSAPAHQPFPNKMFTKEDAAPVTLGATETANRRTIYKYIHDAGINSCQVVMGLTVLQDGSVWNTMPAHTHDRRSEVYLYFDVPENQGVMHFMGRPSETRHLWVSDREAIISPPWSIHAGSGTASYSFIWAMAGENKDFTDMDFIELKDIR